MKGGEVTGGRILKKKEEKKVKKRTIKRKGKEKGDKSSKKLVTVAIAAMIVFSLMPAFMPMAAAATVTAFTITPDTGTAGAKVAYNVTVNATEWSKLNITIPAGFEAVAPTSGDQEIVKADLYNSTGVWCANITITSNSASPSTKVDITGYNQSKVKGDTLTIPVDYSPGGKTVIKSPITAGNPDVINLTLPIGTTSGSLNISLPGTTTLTNATISIGQYAKNPTTAGTYTFNADGTTKAVTINPAAPYKLYINASNPAPGVDYADVEVEVQDQYGNLNTTGSYSVTLVKNGSATVAAPNPNWTKSTGKCTFNVSDSVNEPVLLKAMNSSLQTGEKVIVFSGALHHLAVTLDKYTLYANKTDSATMTVQLKDENDQNLYASGTTINIAYANGTLLAVKPSSNTTDDNGQALFTVTANGVAPATTEITMSETGGSSGTSDTITFKQAPNATNSVFTTPASIKAGETGAGAIITATLKDYNSALIKSSSEFPVTFNMSGDGYFTDSAGAANYGTLKTIDSTDANGNASTYVYSTNASTTLKVNATVVNETGGDVQISSTASIGVDPGTAASLSVSPSLSVGLPNELGSPRIFNISVKDAYGNLNTTVGTIIVTTDNEALGNMTNDTVYYSNNLTLTIASGNASFTYVVNNTTPGTAHLTLNTTAPAGVPDVEITVLTSGPTGVELTFNKTLPLTDTSVEAYAQLTAGGLPIGIIGKNLTFSVSNATGMLEYGERTTNTSGIATYAFNESTAGVYTVRAKNSTLGLDVTGTITFVGAVDHLVASANVSTTTVNSAVNVTATMYDANDSVTSAADGKPVNFFVSGESVGTDTFSNGVASITYTSSTAGLVNITAWYSASVQDTTTVEFTVQALTVTANVSNVIVNTPTAVEFNVTSNGAAVGGALVSVKQAGVELVNGTTATTGLVTLSVNATSTDTVNVTASKTGYTEGTTTITASEAVTCPWDLSGPAGVPDGTVNIFDIVAVADHWGETGTAGWINEDLSGATGVPDGTINIFDIVAVADHWGACPT